MRFPLRKAHRRATRGVALIIVLAFVVLLTGLVVAFFSRSLSDRQISNSSAGQVKIDLFTQGAIATITDDLKQEIAAGSNATYYTDANNVILGSVYVPVNPATAVPALALKGQQTTVTSFAANLVKRSAYQQNFFPGNGDAGAANYNNSNTTATVIEPTTPGATPAPIPAPSRAPSNRAAGSGNAGYSTTLTSQNGRVVSAARWNKALLLPKAPANLTDPTKLDPAPTAFVAPDWVLVARDGSNPGSQSTAASFAGVGAVNNVAPSNMGYVTGRYAYTIYDEGGLLDANVAGYPTGAGKYPSENPAPTVPLQVIPQAKPVLSYADLTIPIPSDATNPTSNPQPNLLTDTQVNALVGWRNYASSKPTGGTFPNYTPGPTASPAAPSTPTYSNFDISALANLNGFTGVNNAPLYNNQSDRMLGSRQELINLFLQGLPSGPTDTATILALQNSLQYFGTFSRSLNQPSYAPVSRVSSATNPSPRPLIQPSAALNGQPGGGNNVGDFYTTPAQQDIFSPSFLNVRAEKTVTANLVTNLGRSDGSNLIAGEPLVKSRFALQRLAWLTYLGPSAARNFPTSNPGINSQDYDMWQLMSAYGITKAYLQKGTAQNIQNYFGLTWDLTNHCWKYNIHNGGTASTPGTGSGSIMKLQDIADQQRREPDFFELLKASVDPGALGKAATNAKQAEPGEPGGNPNSHVAPLNLQFFHDVSLDAAIIQLGANIIDQFDVDGYPTRIVFDDGSGVTSGGVQGSGAREFHGVENLPYIYRVRTGSVKVRDSIPPSQVVINGAGSAQVPYLHSGTQATYTAKPLMDTGAGVIMAVPDIWNPHDQNSFQGSPRPGSAGVIRLVANSAMPDTVYTDSVAGTPNSGYSTYTSGSFVLTDATHGNYRGSSFTDAVPPNVTAIPPIPYFTRGANPSGTLSSSGLVMSGSNGGYNNPHFVNTTNASYLTFKIPDATYFREPTMLGQVDTASGSGLTMVVDPSNLDIINLQNTSGAKVYVAGVGMRGLTANPLGIPPTMASASPGTIGIALGTYPLRWVGPRWSGSNTGTLWNYPAASLADTGNPVYAVTYSLQYQDPLNPSNWITYDDKYVDSDLSFVDPYAGLLVQPKGGAYAFADPRTPRFGSGTENNIADAAHYRAPLTAGPPPAGWAGTWLESSGSATGKLLGVMTERPDISSGFGSNFRGTAGEWGSFAAPGLHTQNIDTSSGTTGIFLQTGLFAQNDPNFAFAPNKPGSDGLRFATDTGFTGVGNTSGPVGPRDSNFWSDPDGVVRRAMGAYVTSGDAVAQPLATASTISNGVGTPSNNGYSQNRPIILNRPFRTVGELGYVFSGSPWKNVDFSTPESGYSELLDVFCANDNIPPDGLVAGTVNLNTRQSMVLKSILTGAYTDEENSFTPAIKGAKPVQPLAAADAETIAKLLKQRTSIAPPASTSFYAANGPQPLQNVGDLVGRWNMKQTIAVNFTPPLGGVHNVDGSKSYDGFSADLTSLTNLSPYLSTENIKIPRLRESAVRALSSVGNTRVWNLMIDVIAQSGRYTPAATALKTASGGDNFIVEGEQRYWVHLAIDRYTGAVLDTKLELVKE